MVRLRRIDHVIVQRGRLMMPADGYTQTVLFGAEGVVMSEVQSSQQLSKLMIGGWMSQAIHVAAELGIADLLTDGPKRADSH